MILVTGKESLSIDKYSQVGYAPDHWMEAAGQLMAADIFKLVPREESIVFLCGPGNNGGDGYVVAKILKDNGYKKISIIYSEPTSDLCKLKFNQIKTNDANLVEVNQVSDSDLSRLLKKNVVIDAVFGVGLSKEIQDPWKKIFLFANKFAKLRISLDIPSGLEASSGNILGTAIRAQHTLVVYPLKSGLFLNEGPSSSGHLHKIDIHFPKKVVHDIAKSVRLIGRNTCKKLIPRRNWSSNKTKFGHVLVIGGSEGFEGAALLTAEAASRAGAGYVSILSDSKKISSRAKPDFLIYDFSHFEKQIRAGKINAIIFGPGLIYSEQGNELFDSILKLKIPVVLDAGGFSFLKNRNMTLPENWIMTPHAGELARLIGEDSKNLEFNRLEASTKAQAILGGVLLFKGFHTVVHFRGVNYIVHSGNPSLSKAGTGDVLSGIIGSFLAQGLRSEKAAVVGAWIHGDLADSRIKSGKSIQSLMASDLVEDLKNYKIY